jgi:hypothetical protein
MKGLLILLGLTIASSSYGFFSVNLDAGLLKGPGGADTMVSDNTPPSNNGSLLLLIDAGPNGTFSNSLSQGHYVSGDDILLGAGGFNSNGGGGTHDETNTVFSNMTAGTAGDLIALRWFPNITFAQFTANVTPIAGQNFGTYNPLANGNGSTNGQAGSGPNNPDGGSLWSNPGTVSGATLSLNFFTTDDFAGGTQTPFEGFANSTVTAIPEPSTYGAAALAALGAVLVRRKFNNKTGSMVQT